MGEPQIQRPRPVYEYIRKAIGNGIDTVAIDEVQEIDRWYEIIRSLVAEGNCNLFITGSNSKLLSGEFSTLLTGRFNLFDCFTLTYSDLR